MKQMASVATAGVSGEATSAGNSEKESHRYYAISYPATRDSTALIEPLEIVVLHPGRTLLEKLVLIHGGPTSSSQMRAQPNPRNGRQFYDVYQLLGDDRVRAFLAERTEVEQVVDRSRQAPPSTPPAMSPPGCVTPSAPP